MLVCFILWYMYMGFYAKHFTLRAKRGIFLIQIYFGIDTIANLYTFNKL